MQSIYWRQQDTITDGIALHINLDLPILPNFTGAMPLGYWLRILEKIPFWVTLRMQRKNCVGN